jgi:hypothetical protein
VRQNGTRGNDIMHLIAIFCATLLAACVLRAVFEAVA